MRSSRHIPIANALLIVGAMAVLLTGADHLDEYWVNQFSTIPTIGTLFLANFIAATMIGIGLLLPLGRASRRVRPLLALGGIGLATSSLIGLWISEQSSLFGFMDHGFRTTVVVAIVAEAVAAVALSAYLALIGFRVPVPRTRTH